MKRRTRSHRVTKRLTNSTRYLLRVVDRWLGVTAPCVILLHPFIAPHEVHDIAKPIA